MDFLVRLTHLVRWRLSFQVECAACNVWTSMLADEGRLNLRSRHHYRGGLLSPLSMHCWYDAPLIRKLWLYLGLQILSFAIAWHVIIVAPWIVPDLVRIQCGLHMPRWVINITVALRHRCSCLSSRSGRTPRQPAALFLHVGLLDGLGSHLVAGATGQGRLGKHTSGLLDSRRFLSWLHCGLCRWVKWQRCILLSYQGIELWVDSLVP